MSDGAVTPDWDAEYRKLRDAYGRLASEVEFALRAITEREGIKVHSVSSRVKTAKSIADKARRKEFDDPLNQVNDIVGIRIVALFLTDLPRLDALVRESFEIHESDDKVTEGDPASFGYMSVHYLATLGDQHSGPRYDDLKDIAFEIQTRTVVMDSWANVSHHLDYKGASSIPEDLRKDFFALSGLFYVADKHFELFAERARESQVRARKELEHEPAEAIEINLDTMEAYLEERYSDRRQSDRASISEFVEEIAKAGYTEIGALAQMLDRGERRFLQYEQQSPPHGPDSRFLDLGAARISLAIADPVFATQLYPSDSEIHKMSLGT
jgi:ppGpp synthetase/RelA/SpoT-type nucleotidyltranferase